MEKVEITRETVEEMGLEEIKAHATEIKFSGRELKLRSAPTPRLVAAHEIAGLEHTIKGITETFEEMFHGYEISEHPEGAEIAAKRAEIERIAHEAGIEA